MMRYLILLIVLCACTPIAHEHIPSATQESNYLMDLHIDKLVANEPSNFTITLKDANGEPPQLQIEHERILHLIAIDKTFTHFLHFHPEDYGPLTKEIIDANFTVHPIFPAGGEYLLAADFATTQHQSLQTKISVEGEPAQPTEFSHSQLQQFGEYIINMVPRDTIRAETPIEIEFNFGSAKGPIFDLEPYLGAPMHFAIVKDDLSVFMHTHGVVAGLAHEESLHEGSHTMNAPNKFGPVVSLLTTFPEPGTYHIFGEFQHKDTVTSMHYVVDVADAPTTI